MENMTIGEIAKYLAFIVAFISSIVYLKNMLVKTVDKTLKPINDKIDKFELNSIKTDLVNFLSMAESGQVTEEQKYNAYELYDKYDELGGNSYVHSKWEDLRKQGKI